MTETIWAALALGFLGSFHCVGMCGALAGALVMSRPEKAAAGLFFYHSGRILTYSILGVVFGLLGAVIKGMGIQVVLTALVGLVLALSGLHMLGLIADPFSRPAAFLSRALSFRTNAAGKRNGYGRWFLSGLVNGLLPCGLVYGAAGLALVASSPWQSAAVMLFFGVGTVPAMTAAPAILRALKPAFRGNLLRVTGVFLILYGVYTGLRGPLLMKWMNSGGHSHAHEMQEARGKSSLSPGM